MCCIELTPRQQRRCSYLASMGQGQMHRQAFRLVESLMSTSPPRFTFLQVHRISSLLSRIHPCSKIVVSILVYGSSNLLRLPLTGPTPHHTKVAKVDQRQDIILRPTGW